MVSGFEKGDAMAPVFAWVKTLTGKIHPAIIRLDPVFKNENRDKVLSSYPITDDEADEANWDVLAAKYPQPKEKT